MTTVPREPETAVDLPVQISGQRAYNVIGQLCELAESTLSRPEYYRRCFDTLCQYFGARAGILNLRLGPRTLEQQFEAIPGHTGDWIEIADTLVLRAQTDETSLVKLYRSQSGEAVAYAFAAPFLSAGNRPFGAVAFVVTGDEGEHSQADLVLLTQLLELIVDNAPRTTAAADPSNHGQTRVLQSVVRASDYQSIDHLAFAIVNSLCSKLSCEQIALGLVCGRRLRLLSVSGLDTVPKNTPGILAVQQAMGACLDRDQSTIVQESGRFPNQLASSACRIHDFWHRLTGGSAVATIPLHVGNRCLAVISMRRKASQPFVQEDIDRAQLLAESFAPALPLVHQASRSLIGHTVDSILSAVSRVCSRQRLGRKALAVGVLALFAWIAFGRMDYHVLAPCKIVPARVNIVAAPFEGQIAEVRIEPGQRVGKGDLLMRMDTHDLTLQRKRVLTEIASTKVEANQLLQDRKPNEAVLIQAQLRVLETDLELIEEHIRRADVRAVEAGVILPSQVHRRVRQFVSVGEPLFEVATEQDWQLEIELPESEARHVETEQTGRFQSIARPDESYAFQIAMINPATTVSQQRNVVLAEASLLERSSWMKVGMEGHVRVKTKNMPVWWIYGHSVIDFLRVNLWL